MRAGDLKFLLRLDLAGWLRRRLRPRHPSAEFPRAREVLKGRRQAGEVGKASYRGRFAVMRAFLRGKGRLEETSNAEEAAPISSSLHPLSLGDYFRSKLSHVDELRRREAGQKVLRRERASEEFHGE